MKFDLAHTTVLLLTAFAPLVALILAVQIERRRRKQIEKPPQAEKLLRPPGNTLAIRLNDTLDSGLQYLLFACGSTMLAGIAAADIVPRLRAKPVPVQSLAVSIGVFAVSFGMGIFFLLRALQRWQVAGDLRLGLRGEQAVAEALNEVAECGYRSFHDLPGGVDWNIDHVTVGARGVFLIETKARRKRRTRDGQMGYRATYDGEKLHFPSGTDANAVPQALRNAKWLSDYLGKKTGEPVEVKPLVVLPGWYVDYAKGNFRVEVMNAKYLVGFLRGQPERVAIPQVKRISAALDEKCRDVEF